MNDNTINADVTMGGAADALLAGRYRVVKQLGHPLRQRRECNDS